MKYLTSNLAVLLAFSLITLSSQASRMILHPPGAFDDLHVETAGYQLFVGERLIDITDLQGLPLFSSEIATKWNATGAFYGVRLLDLLQQAGIKNFQRIAMIAHNNYQYILEPDATGLSTALVTFQLNNENLPLESYGPFWVIWPDQADAVYSGMEQGDKWIWGLVEIRVLD